MQRNVSTWQRVFLTRLLLPATLEVRTCEWAGCFLQSIRFYGFCFLDESQNDLPPKKQINHLQKKRSLINWLVTLCPT